MVNHSARWLVRQYSQAIDWSQEFTWAASAEAHLASYRRAAEQTAADVSAV
jgi:hypothetical protein